MIPVTSLEIRIQADTPIDLGSNPGSALRGALYESLRAMYDTGAVARSRYDIEQNPVAWLLALEDEGTSGGKDVPRPIAVRPPLTPPASRLGYGLSFYGRGRDAIPMVLSAVHAMGNIGVGRGRRCFAITQINQVHPISGTVSPLIDERGEQTGPLLEPPGSEDYRKAAVMLEGKTLTVFFLTPTRIVQRGHLCHRPDFRPWFQRLLERTRLIGELYTESPPWIPFKELLALADEVTLLEDGTAWVEMWSGSRRQGTMRPTSGFAGRVVYGSVHPQLLPWLLLGQGLQVGKNTVKGCGWYHIEKE
jgi:hypothetical protein